MTEKANNITEAPLASPEEKSALVAEIKQAYRLGETPDHKSIYLFDAPEDCALMRELGRLRELTFRHVGEGTGKARDIDHFDRHYRHIILWDEQDQSIVGGYRAGDAGPVTKEHGPEGMYTNLMFEFGEDFGDYWPKAIELGRSFVQPDYWGSRALDYLWQGIGAYWRTQRHVRWLYGPVSASAAFPKAATDHLVFFYQRWFGDAEPSVNARHPYQFSAVPLDDLAARYPGENYKPEFKQLRQALTEHQVSLPTLYKQYTELSEIGSRGVRFLTFGLDTGFADSVDGLILVDLEKMKPARFARYFGE